MYKIYCHLMMLLHHKITTSILQYYCFYVQHTGNISQKYRKNKFLQQKYKCKRRLSIIKLHHEHLQVHIRINS